MTHNDTGTHRSDMHTQQWHRHTGTCRSALQRNRHLFLVPHAPPRSVHTHCQLLCSQGPLLKIVEWDWGDGAEGGLSTCPEHCWEGALMLSQLWPKIKQEAWLWCPSIPHAETPGAGKCRRLSSVSHVSGPSGYGGGMWPGAEARPSAAWQGDSFTECHACTMHRAGTAQCLPQLWAMPRSEVRAL